MFWAGLERGLEAVGCNALGAGLLEEACGAVGSAAFWAGLQRPLEAVGCRVPGAGLLGAACGAAGSAVFSAGLLDAAFWAAVWSRLSSGLPETTAVAVLSAAALMAVAALPAEIPVWFMQLHLFSTSETFHPDDMQMHTGNST